MADAHDPAQCESRLDEMLDSVRGVLTRLQETSAGLSYPEYDARMLDGKQVRPRPKRFGDSPQSHAQLMEMREFFPKSKEGVRTANALMREGMVSVAQLRETPLEQLRGTENIGSGRLAMIRALLEGK